MVKFIENRAISDLTTFGIGGPARYSIDVATIEEMQAVIRECHQSKHPFFILGKGSNCLFDDRGLNGVLIVNKIDFIEGEFRVGAGFSFSRLGALTARRGWSGLEFASGIPGSVGGAIFMNAGANGTETCDALAEVEFVDAQGNLHIYKKEALEFSYRHSSFQEMKGAIVAATFHLQPNDGARKRQLEIIDYRVATQPYGDKSAGCIFRNPAGAHAGALIEKSGLKGVRIGGAEVSPMHANFIVNRENASAEEIMTLVKLVKQKVKESTGYDLEEEVRFIPYDWEPQ